MKNIVELHKNYQEQFEKGEISSIKTRTHSQAFQASQNDNKV